LKGKGEFIGCPSGVNWWVEHQNESDRLHDVVRTSGNTEVVRFDIDAIITFEEYRAAIVTFAAQVKEFYSGVQKAFFVNDPPSPGWEDSIAYDAVWSEFDRLLSRYQTQSAPQPPIT